jgi:hypothetical protein
MGSTLQIDGRALQSGTAGLWKLLLDHTACEKATANLLVQLTEARSGGAIDYCLMLEGPTGGSGGTGDGASWRLQVVRAPERRGTVAEPERTDSVPLRRHQMIRDLWKVPGVEVR